MGSVPRSSDLVPAPVLLTSRYQTGRSAGSSGKSVELIYPAQRGPVTVASLGRLMVSAAFSAVWLLLWACNHGLIGGVHAVHCKRDPNEI